MSVCLLGLFLVRLLDFERAHEVLESNPGFVSHPIETGQIIVGRCLEAGALLANNLCSLQVSKSHLLIPLLKLAHCIYVIVLCQFAADRLELFIQKAVKGNKSKLDSRSMRNLSGTTLLPIRAKLINGAGRLNGEPQKRGILP